MNNIDHIQAHDHCTYHRQQVFSSSICGCFYCCNIFSPEEIVEWTDDVNGIGQTALCPRCGIDSVIGAASGYPLTQEFLERMQKHWF